MTREEAIEFGNMWLEVNEDAKDSNTYEFFQMAIKALKQEPKVDLDELKRKILKEVDGARINRILRYCDVCDRISDSIDKYKAEIEPQKSENA